MRTSTSPSSVPTKEKIQCSGRMDSGSWSASDPEDEPIEEEGPSVLLIEPFCGGSHKQLMTLLSKELGSRAVLYATPDKKWHWKARTSSLYFSQLVTASKSLRTLFASSVLNLAEFVSLRPDLGSLHKILYFHENQLVYPAQDDKQRDFQYGYNQILSALVADRNLFNSQFNLDSFLDNIDKFLSKIPESKPKKSVVEVLRAKCSVLYFPLDLPNIEPKLTPVVKLLVDPVCNLCLLYKDLGFAGWRRLSCNGGYFESESSPLHIVWPHRWEHDKDPDFFVSVLEELRAEGLQFRLSVVGQSYSEIPNSLLHASRTLSDCILYWGFLESKQAYYEVLKEADVVISTAVHEFFGVSMLEAVYFGCYPLVPNRLVYPEIYHEKFLYCPARSSELTKILRVLCLNPESVRRSQPHMRVDQFLWSSLKERYLDLFS